MPITPLSTKPSIMAPSVVTLPRTCNVPGCVNRALKSCAHCGEARCLEHLLPTVDEQRGAVVHLCPTCMEARNNGLGDEMPLAHRRPDVFDQTLPAEVSQRASLAFDRTRADPLADLLPGDRPREKR